MDLIDPQVAHHLEAIVPARDPVLLEMEERGRRTGFPIIGPAAGHFCYQVARMTGARRIFEMGSGFGYSTAWFARAINENGGGSVDHVVWDETLSADARDYLGRLGLDALVRYTVGEAVDTLRKSEGPYDLIFNDIDKVAYPSSLEVIRSRLRPGGVLITDNVLWSGRIFDETDESEATAAIREFTAIVTTSPDWTASIVPIRDGLLLAFRR